MSHVSELAPTPNRQPDRFAAGTRHRVLEAFLLAMMSWLLVMQFAVERSLQPPIGLIQVAFLAIPAVLLLRGRRHAPLLALVFAALTLAGAVPSLVADLGKPDELVQFLWNIVAAPLIVGLVVAAAMATARTYRSA